MTTAISLAGLRKEYPGTPPVVALQGADLEIGDNEFFTLLGPSGCGKTTILRLIAGFEMPTAGALRLYGEEISRLPPEKRPINTVFQQYALFPHMTVFDNVAFGLRRKGTPEAEASRTAAEMLDLVQLGEFGKRKPAQLSGGQQQRVALARALAPRPRVLLLDEPLSALDLKLRQSMRVELKRLQKETGITFVFVTHDQDEALAMSDRIAVMSRGEVQQVALPAEIYEFPENRFVAEFIGDASFFPGRAGTPEGNLMPFILEGGRVIHALVRNSPATGSRVTVMFRPEKAQIAPACESLSGHAGVVSEIVYLGNTTEYRVRLSGDGLELAVRSENHRDGSLIATPGDAVTVNIPPAAVRVLKL